MKLFIIDAVEDNKYFVIIHSLNFFTLIEPVEFPTRLTERP